MIYKLTGALTFLASALMAQQHQLLPGTTASAAASEPDSNAYRPISGKERIDWVVKGTIGPESAAGELFSSGWGALFNSPKAYGTHWAGFGSRLGMSVAGNVVSNTMEAGLGAIWGEDPRYTRDAGAPFGHRVGHAVKMTFLAQNRAGDLTPAYARFIAIPGSNFLSNSWRVDGDNSVNRAVIRTGLGFLGHLGGNTFDEFWPDVRQRVFHRER